MRRARSPMRLLLQPDKPRPFGSGGLHPPGLRRQGRGMSNLGIYFVARWRRRPATKVSKHVSLRSRCSGVEVEGFARVLAPTELKTLRELRHRSEVGSTNLDQKAARLRLARAGASPGQAPPLHPEVCGRSPLSSQSASL